VRELENVIYRTAVIAQGDAILVKDLPAEIRGATEAMTGEGSTPPIPMEATPSAAPAVTGETLSLDRALDLVFAQLKDSGEPVLERVERELVARALQNEAGDEAKAAKLLGVTKAALQKRK
jgi:DNA-binding NtrC family response regulator